MQGRRTVRLKVTGTEQEKALLVTSIWGFIAKFEEDDVRILQDLGYEVHYASNHFNPIYLFSEDVYDKMKVIYHDIPIWQSPYGIKPNLSSIRQVREIIKKENINLVHCHTPTGGMVARLAAVGTGVRIIYTAHGFHFYKGGRKLHNLLFHGIENFLGRLTDDIITINREDYEAAQKLHHRGKTYQIPGSGLDRNRFTLFTDEERKTAREALDITEDTFFIMQIGEIRENKNQETILRTMSILKKQNLNNGKICLGLVGAGKQEPDIRQLAINLDLGNNVKFYGYQEDVRPYLMAADIATAPSFREGFGMAAVEALSMGVPVLASDNRGTREYMQHGINGYVCNSNTPEEYAKWIEKLFQERKRWIQNPEQRRAIRETTAAFDKANKTRIMRRVYEQSTVKTNI